MFQLLLSLLPNWFKQYFIACMVLGFVGLGFTGWLALRLVNHITSPQPAEETVNIQ